MSNAGQMQDRIQIFQRIKTSMIAKRPFGAKLVEIDVTLKNNFRIRGDFEIDRFTLHQLNRLLPKEASDNVFLDIRRRRHNRRKSKCRISPNSNRNFHLSRGKIFGKNRTTRSPRHDVDGSALPRSTPQHFAVMLRRNLLPLPMGPQGFVIMNFKPVGSYVAFAGFGVAGDYAWQRDEASGVFGPALQDGELVKREIIFADDVFAWAG